MEIFFPVQTPANLDISIVDFSPFPQMCIFLEETEKNLSFLFLDKHKIKRMMLCGHSKIKSSFTFY